MRKWSKRGVVHTIAEPILPEFKLHDILQIIIGASVLSVPVGFTEEAWRLGETLPVLNVFGLFLLSVCFITMFSYYQYHKHADKKHRHILVKRVVATYLLSFIVVSVILGLIQITPWFSDSLTAFKRVVIVTFPSSMSAAIADTLK